MPHASVSNSKELFCLIMSAKQLKPVNAGWLDGLSC